MSNNTKLILCPLNLRHVRLDYSAYHEAVAMAQRRGAKLIVATVAPEMERNLNIRDSMDFWTEKLNAFLVEHPPADVGFEAVVRIGAVHRQIVKLAEERDVDVIVMESANPKIQDYLLGTTASHVVTHAPCSVFVVRSKT